MKVKSRRRGLLVDQSACEADRGTVAATVFQRRVSRDLRRHFAGPVGAAYWKALCETPEYGHRDLVRLIDESAPAIARALKSSDAITRAALVSLGPGTGEIDSRVLAHLTSACDVTRYLCVDTSLDLLHYTLARIGEAAKLADRFPVQAVCGDFTQLAGCLSDPAADITLFLLTGFTLGNYNERDLLTRIRRYMAPGDCLFVDARLHGLRTWNDQDRLTDTQRRLLIGGYASPATSRFVFGPVEALTTATIADVSFAHQIDHSVTAVPNAVNITIRCTGLHTRMRATGEPVEQPRLDLAVTTLYDFASLLSWFQAVGFEPRWWRQAPATGLFLLRRAA